MSSAEAAGEQFAELCRIMHRLRGPEGCPWDREQSFETLRRYLLEETYEVLDAIDRRDWDSLREELGDLLLQPVFLAEMAEQERHFSIADSLQAISEKLIRRHPHVFGNATAATSDQVKTSWEQIKQTEKDGTAVPGKETLLDQVPRSFPALVEAEKIGRKASGVGFDWTSVEGPLAKVEEELTELAAARAAGNHAALEHEVGDLLAAVVSVARFLRVDPEQALRDANARFRARFRSMEEQVRGDGQRLQGLSLEELEQLWQAAKQRGPACQASPATESELV